MGKNQNSKELAKLEKKRLKAQIKQEKKRLKTKEEVSEQEGPLNKQARPGPSEVLQPKKQSEPVIKVPWYKNPDWVRAIAAIASLIVAIIAIFIGLFM